MSGCQWPIWWLKYAKNKFILECHNQRGSSLYLLCQGVDIFILLNFVSIKMYYLCENVYKMDDLEM